MEVDLRENAMIKTLLAWRRRDRVGRPIQGFSRDTRVVSLIVFGLLCFQLSRVYLVVPADAYICSIPGHSHSHESEAASGAHHHDDDAESFESAALLQNQDDGRNYVQHCKDTLDDLGLTPGQPFGLAAAVRPEVPEPTHYIASTFTPAVADNFLPAPFEPPRLLS